MFKKGYLNGIQYFWLYKNPLSPWSSPGGLSHILTCDLLFTQCWLHSFVGPIAEWHHQAARVNIFVLCSVGVELGSRDVRCYTFRHEVRGQNFSGVVSLSLREKIAITALLLIDGMSMQEYFKDLISLVFFKLIWTVKYSGLWIERESLKCNFYKAIDLPLGLPATIT